MEAASRYAMARGWKSTISTRASCSDGLIRLMGALNRSRKRRRAPGFGPGPEFDRVCLAGRIGNRRGRVSRRKRRRLLGLSQDGGYLAVAVHTPTA